MAEIPNEDWGIYMESSDWNCTIENCKWETGLPRQSWWRRLWRWLRGPH